jgi:ubiquinone/menaquinone biosynthesis C-methylase UbiE
MLHPLAEQFAAVAGEYERGRPDYPPAVPGALAAELALAPGARVLDLGAGTGKLSRALAAHGGLDVVALEPQPQLREILIGHLGPQRVIDGTAEAIPLADASVDAVTVADAFHWFDRGPALAEIARVLRPGGGLALVSTAPDWGQEPWADALGLLISERRPAHPFFDDAPFEQSLRETPGWSAPRLLEVRAAQPASAERLLDNLRSMSWVAAMAGPDRDAMLGEARDLLAAGVPAELPVRFFMWLAVRD